MAELTSEFCLWNFARFMDPKNKVFFDTLIFWVLHKWWSTSALHKYSSDGFLFCFENAV